MVQSESKIIFQRSLHNKENPYAQINRDLIRDESISPQCRWMLIYFLSMRDDFKINIKQIWNHVKKFMGRNKIYEIIDEACAAGYMKKETKFFNNLKCGVTYYVSEWPEEEFKKCFRYPGFRETEIRDPENGETLRNNSSSLQSEEEKKEWGEEQPMSPPTSTFFSFGRVKMKQELYDKLLEEFGLEKIKEMLTKLDEYADINPRRFKQYACHGAVIRKWIRDDKEKNKNSQKDHEKENRKLAEKIAKRFPVAIEKNLIIIGPDYLEFRTASPNSAEYHIKFYEKGFTERVLNILRKMNVSIEGL